MTTFPAATLSSAAIDVLGQLFVNGPAWDGNVVSKSGRDELCVLGLAEHDGGWAFLTREGVQAAVEWRHKTIDSYFKERWHVKAALQR